MAPAAAKVEAANSGTCTPPALRAGRCAAQSARHSRLSRSAGGWRRPSPRRGVGEKRIPLVGSSFRGLENQIPRALR
eukprot:7623711-Alexandrium_andersonii.AAC.1